LLTTLKRRTLWSAAIAATVVIIFAAGPRYEANVNHGPVPVFDDVEEYVTSIESNVPDIWVGAEKQIVWARPDRSQTERSIVYVHGFSATRQEVVPLCDSLAARLNANLFYARLKGHGRTGEAMADATVGDWLFDLREALAVGRALGRRTVIVASSTGATLAVWAVSGALTEEETKDVEALVLMSPNFGPADSRSNMLLMPWGKQLARLVIGEYREWEPYNEQQSRNWTTRYPVGALFPVMASVDAVLRLNPAEFKRPILVAYSPNDSVVNTTRIVEWFDGTASAPKALLEIPDTGDPSGHILAGDILSPGTTEPLTVVIQQFLESL
jgi:alpha-beta hydrolase superfamily lysophospholipase